MAFLEHPFFTFLYLVRSRFLCYIIFMETNTKFLPLTIERITSTSNTQQKSNFVSILFNIKDVTRVSVNSNNYTMDSSDIIVLNANDKFNFYGVSSSLILIRINKAFITIPDDLAKENYDCNSCTYKNKEKFYNLYSILASLLKNSTDLTFTKAASFAYEFLDELETNFKNTNLESAKTSKISEITSYIEKHYTDNIMLKELADEFDLTVPYLSKLFKEQTNMNFADFYDDLRVKHSMFDLLETNLPIIDVAMKHGFANNQAYIRAYKKINGERPSETRKKNKYSVPESELGHNTDFERIVQEIDKSAQKYNQYSEIYVTHNFNDKPIMTLKESPGTNMVGIGNAKILLYSNIQKIIINMQREVHFKYANMRGIISDDLSFCTRISSGKIIYRFNLIDEIFDFLLSVELRPCLSFTYMPICLAKDKTKTIFSDGFNTSIPQYKNEWINLVESFLEHITQRYGVDEISKWMFTPWTQPDTSYKQFGFSSDQEFYDFYKLTYDTIKKFNPSYIVYSPEMFPIDDYGLDFLDRFLNWTKENDCFPDRLSLQYFANSNWRNLTVQSINTKTLVKFEKMKMSSDPDDMNSYILRIRNYLKAKNYDLPIFITQFNYTITHMDPLMDTLFICDYIIRNYINNMEYINSYSYWNLSDFDDNTLNSSIFYGGAGLFLKNGIEKAQYKAYCFIKRIKQNILSRGEGYCLSADTNDSSSFILILYNYEHPQEISDNDFLSETKDRYVVFKNRQKKKVHLNMSQLPYSHVTIRDFAINKHYGNPYDRWAAMQYPNIGAYHVGANIAYNVLKASSCCDYIEHNIAVNDGRLSIDFDLDEFECKGIQFIFSK